MVSNAELIIMFSEIIANENFNELRKGCRLITKYPDPSALLQDLQNEGVYDEIYYNRCSAAIKKADSLGILSKSFIGKSDNLVMIYPRRGKKTERWFKILSVGYDLIQQKMGTNSKQAILYLPQDIFEDMMREEESAEDTLAEVMDINKWLEGKVVGWAGHEFAFASTHGQMPWQIFNGMHELGHRILFETGFKEMLQAFYRRLYCLRKKRYMGLLIKTLAMMEGYLDALASSILFDIPPHIFLFLWRQLTEPSKDQIISFCQQNLNDLLKNKRIPTSALGSFFHFLSSKAKVNYFTCLNLLFCVFQVEMNFKVAIEELISLKWQEIPEKWAEEIFTQASIITQEFRNA